MNYAADFELKQDKWSDCSNEDFRNYFGQVTAMPGSFFCLKGELNLYLKEGIKNSCLSFYRYMKLR